MRRLTARRLAGLLTAIPLCYFAFWACMPPSVVAPPVPMGAADDWNLGFSASGGVVGTDAPMELQVDGGATAWALRHGDFADWGVAAGGSRSHLGSLGFVFRPRLADDGPVLVDLDLQLGWLWLSLGVPLSFRLGDEVYLYTSPAVAGTATGTIARAPLGVAWSLSGGTWMHAGLDTDVMLSSEPDLLGIREGASLNATVGFSWVR